jgi:N-dimethylarginine dimethylaminohydrolase
MITDIGKPLVEAEQPRTSTESRARLLMCAPTAYSLEYEINPWMSLSNRPDTSLARCQWQELYRTLTEVVGAHIELVPQAHDCPDMVFTANAGLIKGKTALLATFRHKERQLEEAHFLAWFEANGFTVAALPAECKFEGEGDALFVGDALVAGYLKRSDIGSHRWISETLETPVLSLQLADDRWYHLDTCLFALNSSTVVYYPGAFDEYARRVIESNYDTVVVTELEALRFVCNAVVIDRHVVLPSGCPKLEGQLIERGYNPHAVPMSEFLKAGGACKCLTLFLEKRSSVESSDGKVV